MDDIGMGPLADGGSGMGTLETIALFLGEGAFAVFAAACTFRRLRKRRVFLAALVGFLLALAVFSCDIIWKRPFYRAIYCGDVQVVETILDSHPDWVGSHDWLSLGDPPLNVAAHYGQPAIVRLLIARGAEVNPKDEYGTPLHFAAGANSLDVGKVLLEDGADIEARGIRREMTPLHIAARECQNDFALFLLDHGAVVDSRDGGGMTPLMWAADSGCPEVVETLIEHGADVNAQDKLGETPLARAVGRSRTEIVRILLGHGAKVTDPGLLTHAQSSGDREIYRLLKDAEDGK
jgi:ankyrin repeat protein